MSWSNVLGSPSTLETGGRRILAAFDWAGAIDLLDTALLGGNYDSLNEMASALVLEVDSQFGGGTLTPFEARARNPPLNLLSVPSDSPSGRILPDSGNSICTGN